MKLIKSVEEQLLFLKRERSSVKLLKSAILGRGISALNQAQRAKHHECFNSYLGKCAMFIPSSGAASRMFSVLIDLEKQNSDDKRYFINHLSDFPFYNLLEIKSQFIYGQSVQSIIEAGGLKKISDLILNSEGLNFGSLPKGLIPIRKDHVELKTGFQEQVLEVNKLFSDKTDSQLHFTVPEKFKEIILRHIGKQSSVKIGLSVQMPETNTISLNSKGEIFRNSDGHPMTRPGGHGALIHNLNEIDSDIIFIKNIDNITRQNRIEDQVKWKQTLGGVLIALQYQIHSFQKAFMAKNLVENEVILFFKSEFCQDIKSSDISKVLFRPIRVCGMVKNEGLPGGGPYFTHNRDKVSLQIVEAAEIDKTDEVQLEILNSSSHFNPVDIVCGVKNFLGEKYNLLDFVDDSAVIVTHKKQKSENLTVLELPGLWNGSMSDWNTVFIEAPSFTFSPIKTVNDLLKNVD